ncbi:MAG: tRNA (adenosine(37)-N6)-dimethylallyltransferase MiaA [Bacteroidales bacterium]|nr:tRNA (adenosine(37)-N6)-dimethylallyltransferase MiaA [Bacteroidales bacterium]
MLTKYNLIVITGATAGGKTAVASSLANKINGEIISADSRQVYRGMDIGTGKDLEEYVVHGKVVPQHLIDIVDAGYKYNVYEFQKDFFRVFDDINSRGNNAILCGGTGLYIESVLKNYRLIHVPVNESLRKELENKSVGELEVILKSFKKMHNRSDLDTPKRAIRAIEISEFYETNNLKEEKVPEINPIIFGIHFDRDQRRARITERLKYRLENGMIDEAKSLIDAGVSHQDMEYYGLEYKFLSWYLLNKITYEELFTKLNIAIHQFAKRQMTWFRKMEKEGTIIHWIDGNLDLEEKLAEIIKIAGIVKLS